MTNFARRIIQSPLLWTTLLFLSLPLLAFPEIIVGKQTLFWSDLSWIHYPRHIFAAREWLAGRVPLWDPYQHNGLPFLAESQVGALYPLSLLFLSPLSPSLELSLFIVIHFSLAAGFTTILAGVLGMSRVGAIVAGLSFGLGGFLMAQVANLNIMTGAAWLPLILYGVIQTTRRRSWRMAMLAGIPLALQILIAQPQIVFYSLITVAGYGLYRLIADLLAGQSGPKGALQHAGRTLLLLALIMMSGLLLAAPQLLPTFELQQLSVRSDERDLEFLTKNSLPPEMFLNLLLPSLFGNNVTGFKGGDPFQEDFIYIGLIPLLFVFFSGRQRRQRDMPFFLLLLIGGVLLAVGRMTPLYQFVIQYLPGFALFRIPSRWLMVVNLALAILAGYGLESVRQHHGLPKKRLAITIGLAFLIMLGLSLIWLFAAEVQQWGQLNRSDFHQKLLAAFLSQGFTINPIYQDRLLMGWLPALTVPVFLLVANMIGAGLILILFTRGKITTGAFGLLVIVAISIDLTAAGGTTVNPIRPDSWWQQLSGGGRYVLKNVGEARVFPLGMGSERLSTSHLGHYFPSVYQIRSAGGHGSSLMLARTRTFLQRAHPVQAIRLLGVRYLLTEGQLGADAAATYPIAYSDEDSFVYENRNPLPRAMMVHQAIQVETPPEALAYFEEAKLDPGLTVVLETESTLPAPAPSAASSATIIHETPQRLEIEVKAGSDGYLVLLDTFYPGWVASIDDQATPIYRANYIVRAIFVPAGQHTVQFDYRPRSFRLGLWLSLSMLLLLLAVPAVVMKRRGQSLRSLEFAGKRLDKK